MNRVFNFSAGPAQLPEEVLKQAQTELLDFKGSGMSIMEASHRSKLFEDVLAKAEATLRELLGIDSSYTVLFLQGGASTQFSAIPLNLLGDKKRVDFIHTGTWSGKAIEEAKRYAEVRILASSEDRNFSYIPKFDPKGLGPDTAYLHICSNNTIEGTRFTKYPETGNVPLVVDASSHLLSEPLQVGKFGLIFAGAQKNLGPSGLCVVIMRNDLMGHSAKHCPKMLDYQTHAKEKSLYNTPPTFAIYVAGLVFEWVKKLGGIHAMHEINQVKAKLLYDFLDQSQRFSNPVAREDRSLMNVVFVTGDEKLDNQFVKEAEAQGLVNLKGHRSVGGMRASLYNPMPKQGVEKLVEFMKVFEKSHPA